MRQPLADDAVAAGIDYDRNLHWVPDAGARQTRRALRGVAPRNVEVCPCKRSIRDRAPPRPGGRGGLPTLPVERSRIGRYWIVGDDAEHAWAEPLRAADRASCGPGRPANGPTRPPANMATCWTSSARTGSWRPSAKPSTRPGGFLVSRGSNRRTAARLRAPRDRRRRHGGYGRWDGLSPARSPNAISPDAASSASARISCAALPPACYYRGDHPSTDAGPETWPALLAKVTDLDGNLTGLHRTWLDPVTAKGAGRPAAQGDGQPARPWRTDRRARPICSPPAKASRPCCRSGWRCPDCPWSQRCRRATSRR